MTSKQRFIKALNREKPDRLPVTTHHVMKYFLDNYMDGTSTDEFFDYFGMDAIKWCLPIKPDEKQGAYFDPEHSGSDHWEGRRVISDHWQIRSQKIAESPFLTERYEIITPEKTLTMVLQSNEQTSWIKEYLIKEKAKIELIERFAPTLLCDTDTVNQISADFGERGIVRGHIICADIYGQPGCWQDACCLFGTENMILQTYDDPGWVHEFLKILQHRKLKYIRSLKGAKYDLMELGGGDASSTVISPKIFNNFVAPYDAELIEAAHQSNQRIVYHTCGGMMPILKDIAAMMPDAMETFTPKEMGGDVNLAEAKKQIGDQVCMIGGFDQFHYFQKCSPEKTRAAVRRCFRDAGENGGYILCPSDHFFDADVELIEAYVDEAKKCRY